MDFNPSVREVIETFETRGDGKTDPYRRVRTFWTLDGKFLAEDDPETRKTYCSELFFIDTEKLEAFKEALELIYLGDWSAISGTKIGSVNAPAFAEEILKKYGEFECDT